MHINPYLGDTIVFNGVDNLPNKSISDFAIHPNNPNILVVSFMGYDTTGGYLYISYDALSANPTFTRINSVPNIPIYSVAFNPLKPDNALLIGTEKGLWFISDVTQGSSYPAYMVTDEELYGVPIKDISFFEWVLIKEFVSKVGDEEFYQYRLIKEPWPTLLLATDGLGVVETYAGNATNIKILDNSEAKATTIVYPNPVTKNDFKVKIQVNSSYNPNQKGRIKIYDITGTVVYYDVFSMYKEHIETIPTQHFANGIYIVEILIPEIGYKNSHKIIINR